MDTPSLSVTTVTNHGTIIGTGGYINNDPAMAEDGDGIDVDGLLNLDNFGTIQATGVHVVETAGRSTCRKLSPSAAARSPTRWAASSPASSAPSPSTTATAPAGPTAATATITATASRPPRSSTGAHSRRQRRGNLDHRHLRRHHHQSRHDRGQHRLRQRRRHHQRRRTVSNYGTIAGSVAWATAMTSSTTTPVRP